MIGQAGGLVVRRLLQRSSPCSCLHLADAGERRHPGAPPRADSGVRSAADAAILTASPACATDFYFQLLLRTQTKFPFCWEIGLSSNFFRAEMRPTFW